MPRTLTLVAEGSRELDGESWDLGLSAEAVREDGADRPKRSDGLALRSTGDVVTKNGQPMLVADVTRDGAPLRSFYMPAPAGGVVEPTLSVTGKWVVWLFSRSGPVVQSTMGNVEHSLPWKTIVSPDDVYALEPAYAHGFTGKLEHGRDVLKLDLASGKKRVVSHVPESSVPRSPSSSDDEMSLNERTAVAIGPTGCVYATSHPGELAVYRAKDDAKVVSCKDPGPAGTLLFTMSGRYLKLRWNEDGSEKTFRLDR